MRSHVLESTVSAAKRVGAPRARWLAPSLLVFAFAFGALPAIGEGVVEVEWLPRTFRLHVTAALFALAVLASLWPRSKACPRRSGWWQLALPAYLAVTYGLVAVVAPVPEWYEWAPSLDQLWAERWLLERGWPVWCGALVVAADTIARRPLQDTAITRRISIVACALWGWGTIAGDSEYHFLWGAPWVSPAWEAATVVMRPLTVRAFYSSLALGAAGLGLVLVRRRRGPLPALTAFITAALSSQLLALLAACLTVDSVRHGVPLALESLALTAGIIEAALFGLAAASLTRVALARVFRGPAGLESARRWRGSLMVAALLSVGTLELWDPGLTSTTYRAQQRPDPLWIDAGVVPLRLTDLREWAPAVFDADSDSTSAVLTSEGEVHLFRLGSHVVLRPDERVRLSDDVTMIFDRRATLGDLRRAASQIEAESLELAFLSIDDAHLPLARSRWPFVEMATRTIHARTVFLVSERSAGCEPVEGGPAPFACCPMEPTSVIRWNRYGPRMLVQASDALPLGELLEAASGSDGTFELVVPRDHDGTAVPWSRGERIRDHAPSTWLGWRGGVPFGVLVAVLMVAGALVRARRAHRALVKDSRFEAPSGAAGVRLPPWLGPRDADVEVMPPSGGAYRDASRSSITTARSLDQVLVRELARGLWGSALLTVRGLLVVGLPAAAALHVVLAPVAPAEPISAWDGHMSFGSRCDGRHTRVGRCCARWPY